MAFNLGGVGKLLFGSKGPSSPYSPTDFSKLFSMDLESPGNAYDYSGAQEALMSLINAPSSTESVLNDVEGSDMASLLKDIDTETRNSYGSAISDMADRGLIGEGQSSDIAANALAQVQGMGARTKSGVRSDYAKQRLARLTQKEQAAQNAQSNWVNLLAGMSENARTRNLNRILGLSGQQTQAYGQSANLANTRTPGILQDMLAQFSGSYASGAGSKGEGLSTMLSGLFA